LGYNRLEEFWWPLSKMVEGTQLTGGR